MEPITLKLYAHIPSGVAWAFFVADEKSGLKLPICRETWTISEYENCISIDCELDLNLKYDKFLDLKYEDGYLVCEQGALKLLSTAVVDTQQGREIINCIIMLDGFSEGKADKMDYLEEAKLRLGQVDIADGPTERQIMVGRALASVLIALVQRLDAQAADAYLDTRVANIERGTLRIYRRLAILEESGLETKEAK